MDGEAPLGLPQQGRDSSNSMARCGVILGRARAFRGARVVGTTQGADLELSRGE